MQRLPSQFSSIQYAYAKAARLIFALSIAFLLLVRIQTYVPVEMLTRDPAAIVISPFYYGAISNLGVQLWTATGVVCGLSATLLYFIQGNRESMHFLVAFGCLSILLGLDDLFMLHELVLPNNVGIHESVVITSYAVTFLLCLFRFHRSILKVQPHFFLLSVALLTFSVAFDVLPTGWLSNNNIYWIEDGSKFLGILVWFLYFFWASIRAVLLSIDHLLSEQSSKSQHQDI